MPGIFGNLGSGAKGMFGGLAPYSNSLLMGGMGMLAGNNMQEGFQNAMYGVRAGSEMDQGRQDRKKEAERLQALHAAMQAGDLGQLSPTMQGLVSSNPELGMNVAADRLKPKTNNFGFTEVDGALVRTDPTGGGAQEVYRSPNAGQADGPKITAITALRKDYENQPGTSRYRSSIPILQSMSAATADTTAMADLDFIYGMAQIFDPDSVVRETEMGMVIDSQSMPAALKGRLEKVLNGQASLGPQARKDLVEASKRRVQQYRTQAEGEATQYQGIATRNRITPEDVLRPLEPLPEEQPTQQMQPGATFDHPEQIPEGATVKDEFGRLMIKRNGQLVPAN